MVEVFGEDGKHTRSSIGVYSLPSNSAIEIDAIFALK
jgi:enamine deaminase RidA (YjgF/YER057c/UK114 family)